MHDVLLDEDEEKRVVLPDTDNHGESKDEYADSEDEPDIDTDSQRRLSWEFLWTDDQSGAAVLAFLFMICVMASFVGYQVTPEGSNRFVVAIGASSIWSIMALLFILYDPKGTRSKRHKPLEDNLLSDYNGRHGDDDEDDMAIR